MLKRLCVCASGQNGWQTWAFKMSHLVIDNSSTVKKYLGSVADANVICLTTIILIDRFNVSIVDESYV